MVTGTRSPFPRCNHILCLVILGGLRCTSARDIRGLVQGVQDSPLSHWTRAYQTDRNADRHHVQLAEASRLSGTQSVCEGDADFMLTATYSTRPLYSSLDPDLITIPVLHTPLVFTFNLGPSVDQLTISSDVMRLVASRVVTQWDHPSLTALNPGVRLPSARIEIRSRRVGWWGPKIRGPRDQCPEGANGCTDWTCSPGFRIDPEVHNATEESDLHALGIWDQDVALEQGLKIVKMVSRGTELIPGITRLHYNLRNNVASTWGAGYPYISTFLLTFRARYDNPTPAECAAAKATADFVRWLVVSPSARAIAKQGGYELVQESAANLIYGNLGLLTCGGEHLLPDPESSPVTAVAPTVLADPLNELSMARFTSLLGDSRLSTAVRTVSDDSYVSTTNLESWPDFVFSLADWQMSCQLHQRASRAGRVAVPLGFLGLVFVVGTRTPYRAEVGLHLSQLRAVLAGQVTDWDQVLPPSALRKHGLEGVPIQILESSGGALMASALRQLGLDGSLASYNLTNLFIAPSLSVVSRRAHDTPGVIGVLPVHMATDLTVVQPIVDGVPTSVSSLTKVAWDQSCSPDRPGQYPFFLLMSGVVTRALKGPCSAARAKLDFVLWTSGSEQGPVWGSKWMMYEFKQLTDDWRRWPLVAQITCDGIPLLSPRYRRDSADDEGGLLLSGNGMLGIATATLITTVVTAVCTCWQVHHKRNKRARQEEESRAQQCGRSTSCDALNRAEASEQQQSAVSDADDDETTDTEESEAVGSLATPGLVQSTTSPKGFEQQPASPFSGVLCETPPLAVEPLQVRKFAPRHRPVPRGSNSRASPAVWCVRDLLERKAMRSRRGGGSVQFSAGDEFAAAAHGRMLRAWADMQSIFADDLELQCMVLTSEESGQVLQFHLGNDIGPLASAILARQITHGSRMRHICVRIIDQHERRKTMQDLDKEEKRKRDYLAGIAETEMTAIEKLFASKKGSFRRITNPLTQRRSVLTGVSPVSSRMTTVALSSPGSASTAARGALVAAAPFLLCQEMPPASTDDYLTKSMLSKSSFCGDLHSGPSETATLQSQQLIYQHNPVAELCADRAAADVSPSTGPEFKEASEGSLYGGTRTAPAPVESPALSPLTRKFVHGIAAPNKPRTA